MTAAISCKSKDWLCWHVWRCTQRIWQQNKTHKFWQYIWSAEHTRTQPFNGLWSGTTRVGRYQKKHSPTHTHPDHQTSFINFLHLLWSIASSMFSLHAWQSSLTTSLQVLFGLPLGLGPSTSYSMHFFTHSSSSFRSTWPYHHSLFCCNTNAMLSIPSLSLSSLLGNLSFTLMPHIHLTILISAHLSATTFSFLTGQVSLPCNILHMVSWNGRKYWHTIRFSF